MKKNVYSLYDTKACTYSPPMIFGADAEASRSVKSLILSGDNQVAQYPDDFVLVCAGTFNERTGELVGHAQFTVCTCSNLLSELREEHRRNSILLDSDDHDNTEVTE